MGLTDGHLVWGDDIPTESEKVYYRQIAELEKENARLLKDCDAYKKAIENIKAEIKEEMDFCATISIYTRLGFDTALHIIDKHISGKKDTNEDKLA